MASATADRLALVTRRLRAAYPGVKCELDFKNPLQLLVAVILSAQCTDVLVNQATPALFARCRTAEDYASASVDELDGLLQRINFHRAKAKNLRACGQALVDRHDGKVPRTMEELVELAGVGRKTANVVLGNAFGIEAGVVVDTHVTRLSFRLGLTRETDPVKIERVLAKLVPQAEWTIFSHLLIWHGRRRCTARKPDCPHCEVQELCPKRGVDPKFKAGAKPFLQK